MFCLFCGTCVLFYVFFYCFCSIVLSEFLLCYVVCRFILANKPIIMSASRVPFLRYSASNNGVTLTYGLWALKPIKRRKDVDFEADCHNN